jgi:SAM-dependent methyltransferase
VDRRRLACTFEEDAAGYDRARPGYPASVVDDLVGLAELGPGARVVEIGSGTGQATIALAERGLAVTALELGPSLAELARRRLARYPAVEVVTTDAETWRASVPFDAVVAFTSFHWLDRDTRYRTVAGLLRPGGALGVVITEHVLPPEGDPFFREAQADYEAVLPDDPKTVEGGPGLPDDVPDLAAEIAASGLFGPAEVRRHVWDVDYDADGYLDLLRTFSNHRVMAPAVRDDLLDRIRRRIEARPGRRVRRSTLAIVHVARRLGGS